MSRVDSALNREDRDMIISLNVKVDRLITDVKDIKDDSSVRMAKMEAWKETVDNYHATIDLKHFRENSEWVDGLKSNWKLIVGVGGLILTVVEAVLPNLVAQLLHLKF